MPTVDVYNLKREKTGSLTLRDDVFAVEVAKHLLHEVVTAQLSSKRAGTSAAKERSAVRGSKHKIYKQKGTGRARHGGIRAPVFVGGGRAHPPKPQDWARRPPRRIRLAALKSALSLLLGEGRLTVVENFDLVEIKTKTVATALLALGKGAKAPKTLVVDAKDNDKLKLSIRNIDGGLFLPPEGVNVYDLLRHQHLIVSKRAVAELEARCTREAA
ncbi:MAG TPA: 50S ribosomal protein L4 [Polyangiaceae bacterium]|nr:50S ribosomal protein L4 [Polyangiaceae bacterium]